LLGAQSVGPRKQLICRLLLAKLRVKKSELIIGAQIIGVKLHGALECCFRFSVISCFAIGYSQCCVCRRMIRPRSNYSLESLNRCRTIPCFLKTDTKQIFCIWVGFETLTVLKRRLCLGS